MVPVSASSHLTAFLSLFFVGSTHSNTEEGSDEQVPEAAERSEKKPSVVQMEEPEKRAQQWEKVLTGCEPESGQPLHGFQGVTASCSKLWGHPPAVSG